MSDAIEAMGDLPGWLISAARTACAFGYRELATAAKVSNSWLQRIEKLQAITIRHERGRGAEGIDIDSMQRLLSVFRRHGLELRAAVGGHHAALVCVDPKALQRARVKGGKGE
jgi:hypothetical protein